MGLGHPLGVSYGLRYVFRTIVLAIFLRIASVVFTRTVSSITWLLGSRMGMREGRYDLWRGGIARNVWSLEVKVCDRWGLGIECGCLRGTVW